MQKGTVFRGFKEHLITFKPTYKYVLDTGIIKTYIKTFVKVWLPYF